MNIKFFKKLTLLTFGCINLFQLSASFEQTLLTQEQQAALEQAVAQATAQAVQEMLEEQAIAELQGALTLTAEEVAEINQALGIPAQKNNQECWQQRFACNFYGCNQKFREEEYLNGHIAANHLNKKYKCGTCNSFSTNNIHDIRKHESTHLQKRQSQISFSCTYCDKRFKSKETKKFHQKKCPNKLIPQ